MRSPAGFTVSFCLMLFSIVSAQTETSQAGAQTVAKFLATLQNHPAVQAQAALLAAAQAQLEAVYSPVSFSASANYTRLALDLPEAPPGEESP